MSSATRTMPTPMRSSRNERSRSPSCARKVASRSRSTSARAAGLEVVTLRLPRATRGSWPASCRARWPARSPQPARSPCRPGTGRARVARLEVYGPPSARPVPAERRVPCGTHRPGRIPPALGPGQSTHSARRPHAVPLHPARGALLRHVRRGRRQRPGRRAPCSRRCSAPTTTSEQRASEICAHGAPRRRAQPRDRQAARDDLRHALRPRGHPRPDQRPRRRRSTSSRRSPTPSSCTASSAPTPTAIQQAAIIVAAVRAAPRGARQAARTSRAWSTYWIEVHRLENEGDRIARAGRRRPLRRDGDDPIEMIKWKDVYALLEDGDRQVRGRRQRHRADRRQACLSGVTLDPRSSSSAWRSPSTTSTASTTPPTRSPPRLDSGPAAAARDRA